METKKTTILSLSPGLKTIGFAHLEDKELFDYGIKRIRKSKDMKSVFLNQARVIKRLIENIQPDVIVVENIGKTKTIQNLRLSLIMNSYKVIARNRNVYYRDYSLDTILKAVCHNIYATKRELARTVAIEYPQLKTYIKKEYSRREQYHMKIFKAVACGITFLDNNKDKRQYINSKERTSH